MLDALVLLAMAVTATAFAAGLIVHSGIDVVPGLIAGTALYLVMASCHFAVTRAAGSATVGGRIDELQEAIEIIDTDIQRIDQVEDDVARLDLLNDRVERLDRTVAEYEGTGSGGGMGRVDQLAADFEHLHLRLEALRDDLANEARAQRDNIGTELKLLEGLVKQLSRELMDASAAIPAVAGAATPEAAPLPVARDADEKRDEAPVSEVQGEAPTEEEASKEEGSPTEGEAPARGEAPTQEEDIVDLTADDVARDEGARDEVAPDEVARDEVAPDEVARDEVAPDEVARDKVAPDEVAGDKETLQIVRQAIERSRIDLYLQPIVALPERKLRYYEALTRIRTSENDLILPAVFIPVAETAKLMPLIDNVMLVKSVQGLRRLSESSKVKGVFCNLSVQSLLDPDYFPELVEFMEENSSLSESLTFGLSQTAIRELTLRELESLHTLGKLGFGFSLDHVADLDVDFAGLRDRHFRFVKIEAKTFLHGMEEAGSRIDSADMRSYLRRFDLELIVEKVEDEKSLDRLIDYGVELAQGYLFGEPKPMSPEMFRELEDADAA
jgi:cyclic-di-GMP phosphodiesterase, flagellum assembly factor TipF